MGLLRNAAFVRQMALLCAAEAAVVAGALAVAGGSAAAAAGCAGVAAAALFATCSAMRYREIARLAGEADAVLHERAGGRRIEFSDYREGDLAILRNELAKMTATLRDANTRLEAEKVALADALADVSHQIRTPLTAMSLMVARVERAADAGERARELRQLEGMIDRVGWLVTALLKLAKADAGAIRVQHAPVCAQAVVRTAFEPLAVSFDVHGVGFRAEGDPAARFDGDAAWSAEAVENILKNCLEHTPDGGEVRVAVSEDAVACRIRIVDSGPGFSDEDLPHVFERFYRGRNAGAGGGADGAAADAPRAPQGFGVGLALAQALVAAQGGTLRAGNAREGGAQFDLVFPKMTV